VRKATLTINLTHRSDRPGLTKQAIEAQLREALAACCPGARVKVGFGGSSEKYVLVLAGEDGACWPNTRQGGARTARHPRHRATSPPVPAWCGPS
jgi:hypothetical protein